jgi:hypothetical protein
MRPFGRLGYHATEEWETPGQWGLPADHKKIHLLQGIVFPWLVGSEVWRATFQRDGGPVPKDERYRPIAGGGKPSYRINSLCPNAPAMLVEGDLDALSIMQQAGDLLPVVATGSTAGGRMERWSAGAPCVRACSWRSMPTRRATRLRLGGSRRWDHGRSAGGPIGMIPTRCCRVAWICGRRLGIE